MFDLSRLSLQEIITVSFTLFAVIDMLGSAPVLITLKQKLGKFKPNQATIVSGLLMIIFLFVGEPFLKLLGLDIPSFAVAGSIVIFILGLEMVLNIEFFRHDPGVSNTSGNIVPIAFPLIAGSGTLTTIMSLKANFYDGNILIGIFINLVVIFIVLHSLKWVERALGPAGLLVMRKFFGVILLAIAVKIFTSNAKGFFD